MKKLSLMIVTVAAMIFSVQNAEAQVTEDEKVPQEQKMHAQEDWTSIQAADLPPEVQAAVERDFADANLTKALVADKEGVKTYKLVITTADGKTKKLYADAQGNWIKKHKKDKS
ncbi:MAG TPA: hypothetical protein VFI78_04250 [Salinimicrobium sp.]|nr:hypothetical protein [Salinimicrobium sp.]